MEAGVVRHHLEVVGVEGEVAAAAVQVQCYSVGVQAEAVQAEGQVFRAVAEVVVEGQVQPADQREEAEGEAMQLVQLK